MRIAVRLGSVDQGYLDDLLEPIETGAEQVARDGGAVVARKLSQVGFAVDQVAQPIGHECNYQREVRANGGLKLIGLSVYDSLFVAVGEQGAEARRGVESADARPGGADPLGEVALCHQLKLDLDGVVRVIEIPGIGLAGKRADDLAYLACGDRGGEAAPVPGSVVDHDQV